MKTMDGVLVIDKPAGVTSHDVVDEVRRILHERRIGHTGTLDPFATGVLAILVGRATRLAQFLSGLEKQYEAVIRLGYATDTGDITGQAIKPESQRDDPPLRSWATDQAGKQLEAAFAKLRGEIDQVPPMYSAKKQGGRKLYELARRGEEVKREPVRVNILGFEPLKSGGELLKDNLDGTFDLEVRVECSSGTYIRTLAEDFGKLLGVGAHVAELRRTRVGDFDIQQAATLDQLKLSVAEEALGTVLISSDAALSRLPFFDLNPDEVRRIQNGMPILVSDASWSDRGPVRLRDHKRNLIAVARFDKASASVRPSVVIARDDI
ncbi:MAG TPA: tRNA pseudouridine(55) synthase TruB [Pyrinomonadaceae bacterium]